MLKRSLNQTSEASKGSVSPPSTNFVSQPETLTQEAWRKFRRNRQAMFGMVILLIIVLSVIFGPFIYQIPFNKIDFAKSTLGPSWVHPFGTNDLGQDILARVLHGGRISITVGIFSMLVAITIGTLIGALAGFYGGWLDIVLMRFTDLCLALPRLPLLLLVIFLFRDALKAIAGPEIGIFVFIVLVIVPKIIAAQVMELARRLDYGENIELDTKSKSLDNDFVIKSNFADDENITKSQFLNQKIIRQSNQKSPGIDFVTKSIPSYSQAIKMAKKVLKHKKSARISIAKIISKIYEQSLSPDDLKSYFC
ncbi:ABC.PE.P1, peptide/nickel transport system permease protein [Nostoc flagelliforme CCNUN1]|uniref:ABC.PE.P1, peptide/nickel transport system permease protein n=2 Tax=Nostoc flagelliforme TaxID=1306274 RepID=A0A2K8SHR5_9NOSO|nr:ABC.PE.P1, peptide/nickel transport system permease protein [Nostoc flagelliforme CCNUN1]